MKIDSRTQGQARDETAGPAGTRTILVVDDVKSVRMFHASFLKRRGYACLEASDGVEALSRIGANPVSLVLLDMHMPNMDGREFIHRLRADPKTQSLPILVVTSDIVSVPHRHHPDAAQLAILEKPAPPKALLEMVRRIIG